VISTVQSPKRQLPTMLEAKLAKADLLKKILDAVGTMITDANFEVNEEGVKLQAMDNSHVALVSLELQKGAFEDPYRCDRNMILGVNLANLIKIVKCAGNDDEVTLRADGANDNLSLMFQNTKTDRMGEYEMRLMDIDQEHLGIPETVYDATIELPSSEFQRIVRDLLQLGESVKIDVTKEGVKFSAEGEIGTAAVTLRPTAGGGRVKENHKDDDDEDMSEDDVKPEVNGHDEDDDEENDEEDDAKPAKKKRRAMSDEEDDEVEEIKPPKKAKGKAKVAPTRKVAKTKDADEPRKVSIHLSQSVGLTFSLKYLNNFAKSTSLADYVSLHMSNEVPLLVEYKFDGGSLCYYLAPKISEE